jgi:hypothetical protein
LLSFHDPGGEDPSQVRLLHGLAKIHATFDDANLVSRAGLVPVVALAQRAGLGDLSGEHVRVCHRCGVGAQVKVPCLVAGMIGGADSIDDLDLLRHGAMPALLEGIRTPSTLGSFLRSFTWGNARQAEKAGRAVAGGTGPPGAAAARQGCAGVHRPLPAHSRPCPEIGEERSWSSSPGVQRRCGLAVHEHQSC